MKKKFKHNCHKFSYKTNMVLQQQTKFKIIEKDTNFRKIFLKSGLGKDLNDSTKFIAIHLELLPATEDSINVNCVVNAEGVYTESITFNTTEELDEFVSDIKNNLDVLIKNAQKFISKSGLEDLLFKQEREVTGELDISDENIFKGYSYEDEDKIRGIIKSHKAFAIYSCIINEYLPPMLPLLGGIKENKIIIDGNPYKIKTGSMYCDSYFAFFPTEADGLKEDPSAYRNIESYSPYEETFHTRIAINSDELIFEDQDYGYMAVLYENDNR